MRGLFAFVAMTVGGWVGWWLGGLVNVTLAFVLSLVGSAVALFLARRWIRDYLG